MTTISAETSQSSGSMVGSMLLKMPRNRSAPSIPKAISAAEGFEQVGFCLDTCHAWAGGIELGDAVERVRAITGRIDLVHANDSRDAFDSGADRHTNFGEGKVDPDAFVGVIRSAGAPVIAETPGDPERHKADFEWLRSRL